MSFEGSFQILLDELAMQRFLLDAPLGVLNPTWRKWKLLLPPFDYLKWFSCFNFRSVLMTLKSGPNVKAYYNKKQLY